jgi:hypothetical protein
MRFVLPFAALALVSHPALAQVSATGAERPVGQATALTEAPTIDGNVTGDPAWQGARAIEQFWQIQPSSGQPASQRTQVFVGFTDRALYIGMATCSARIPRASSTTGRSRAKARGRSSRAAKAA